MCIDSFLLEDDEDVKESKNCVSTNCNDEFGW